MKNTKNFFPILFISLIAILSGVLLKINGSNIFMANLILFSGIGAFILLIASLFFKSSKTN